MKLVLYTMSEVAERFRCSRSAVRKVVKKHPTFFKRAGSTTLIDNQSLEQLRPAFDEAARPGTIYVVGFADFVKIGYSSRPQGDQRLKVLRTAVPLPLVTYATLKGPATLEYELHKRFAPLRLQGEWFRKEGDLALWIEAGCPL